MSEVVSVLSSLEPSLGISFALNLAYIGLPRFRYREEVRGHVSEILQSSFNGNEDQQVKLGWYQTLARLAGKEITATGVKIGKGVLPDGVWSKSYLFFDKKVDRFLAISSCVASAGLIFLGVGHSIGQMVTVLGFELQSYFSFENIGCWYTLVFVMTVFPLLFVQFGSYFVACAKGYSSKQIADILATMQANVLNAKKPETKKAI